MSTDVSPESLLDDARALLPELVALRRDLHRHPEVGLDLPRTQATVLEALQGLDLEIARGTATSSVVAVLRGGRPGPAVLLRGDMDALPIAEPEGLDFAATNGAMHACGHDLHTAGLVGAARLLHARRDNLPGDVIFMFQPGEEGHGGARVMLDEGVLGAAGAEPAAAFGIHVSPHRRGLFSTRAGAILAGSAELRIVVRGGGGHGSQPHAATDPIPAAADLVGALQTGVARRFRTDDPIVLSITRIRAGDALNIIPDSAEIGGTVRMVSSEAADQLPGRIREVAEGIAAAYGCVAEVDFRLGYPVTVNSESETAMAVQDLIDSAGHESVMEMPHVAMGSEDFSQILERVPGTYVFLGARPDDIPDGHPGQMNHSPTVVFDDSVLATQAAVLALLAGRSLRRHG